MTLGTLGGHQDDAARGSCAVDGGAGRILQHGDGLDVVRVHQVDIALHVVNQDERGYRSTIAAIAVLDTQRVGAADLEGLRGCGAVAAAAHQQAGHGALQSVRGFRQRAVAQHLIHLHGGDGTGQVGLLLRAEAHDHHFVQLLGVLLEGDVQRLAVPCDGLFDVPDVTDFQHSARTDVGDGEPAVEVGDHALGAAFYYNGGADDGLSVSVFHYALALTALLYGASVRNDGRCL